MAGFLYSWYKLSKINKINNMPDSTPPILPEKNQTPAPKNSHFKVLQYAGLVVLIAGFFVLGWFGKDWLNGLKNLEKKSTNRLGEYKPVADKDQSKVSPGQGLPAVPADQANSSDPSAGVGQDIWLSVEWQKKTLKTKCPSNGPEGAGCYLAGKIVSGEYAGQDLILELVPGLGTDFIYHAVSGSSDNVLSDKIRGINDVPELIDFGSTGYQLKRAYRQTMFNSASIKWKLFDHPSLGPVYLMDNGCLMVELPDHTAIAYDLVIPFVNRENGNVDITFSDGGKNTEAYQYNAITGCGALCYYLAIQDESVLKPQERLILAGTTSNQEPIYVLKDSNDKLLQNLYADKNTVAYMADNSYDNTGKNKYTYQEFLSYHPLLYWKDPLGRWVEFKNQRFILAAEMCKPVIYLYPETQTNLEVRVSPNGGFTYSNPKYENGWKVSATPKGEITEIKTGKKYEYLFWEGIGLNYPVSEKGWVVKRGDLEKFLDAKLPEVGLKGREANDFKTYWLGRLSEHPYYKLSFLSKEQMDELAPLDISGARPNTVIRMLMTAKGLDQNETAVPQDLPVLKNRSGFTVVEWGGVVLK